MACGCATYECLEVFVNPCNEGTSLGITATTTGDYTIEVYFNGSVKRMTVTVAANEEISIPTSSLNENYVHDIRVISPSDVTTCYHASTIIDMNVADAPFVPANSEWRLLYTVEETSDTITIEGLKPVTAILLPNGTLTQQQFTQVGDSITYTDGEFYEGDEIVLIF